MIGFTVRSSSRPQGAGEMPEPQHGVPPDLLVGVSGQPHAHRLTPPAVRRVHRHDDRDVKEFPRVARSMTAFTSSIVHPSLNGPMTGIVPARDRRGPVPTAPPRVEV